jgi:hypothetical protein
LARTRRLDRGAQACSIKEASQSPAALVGGSTFRER